MIRFSKFPLLQTAFFIMASSSAFAELLIDPVSSLQAHQSSLGLSFSKSKIDYDLGKNYEVERKIVGFYGQFAMKDALAAFAHFGVISDVEYERIEGDGDGHMIGVGLRGTAYRQDKLDIIAFGTVNMIDEKISDIKKISGLSVEGAGIKFKSNLTELEAGALATYHTTPTFQVYGGLAMVPYSDGDSKFSGGFDEKYDIERDDMMTLRLGGEFEPNQSFSLHAGLAMVSETTFTLGAEAKF